MHDIPTHGETVTSSAPGKIILFGEHFIVHGTDAILCAIDRHVYVTAAKTESGIHITSDVGELKTSTITEDAPTTALMPLHHLARAAARRAGYSGGITLQVRSEIPPGAGLGSSSACCAAAASAVLGLLGLDVSDTAIMDAALDAERTIHPNLSGADTTASLYGGIFLYNRGVGYIGLEPHRADRFGLVVSNSGTAHDTDSMVRRVQRFRDNHVAIFSRLRKGERELIQRAVEILSDLEAGAAAESLGRLAAINQSYLRKIGVSSPELDRLVDAMQKITYGAKITGAGGGGCVVAFADAGSVRGIVTALQKMGYRDSFAVGIDEEGLVLSC